MKKLLIPGAALALLFLIAFQAHAVTLPGGEALFETSLASRISPTDTSMTLVSNSVGGSAISGFHCFTIDEGRSDSEFVCGTVSGTGVTGLTRGISYTNGTSSVLALEHVHRASADVKITDYPLIQILRNILNGQEALPNLISYVSNVAPVIGHYNVASWDYIKAYADALAVAGAPNGDDITKGIYQRATGAQAAAGTASGSTAANLVLGANIATWNCLTAANSVLISSSTTGKLSPLCFDQTANYSMTGANTFARLITTATTTIPASSTSTNPIVLNGLGYAFPSTQGASSTFLATDGTGKLIWATSTTNVISTSTTLAAPTSNGSSATANITCSGQQKVSGGGFSGIPANTAGLSGSITVHEVQANYASAANTWTVTVGCLATNSSTCGSGTITVYAMCVNP